MDGKIYSFGVSGKLYKNALVMYDRQTGSLWSHFTGRALKGKLKGMSLKIIASFPQVKYSAWVKKHPETKVLSVNGIEHIRSDRYADYHSSPATGISKVLNMDNRLPQKELVIGITNEGSQKAYPLKLFQTNKIISDDLNGVKLFVYYDKGSGFSAVYFARLEGNEIELSAKGIEFNVAADKEGNKWDLVTGESIEGNHKGKRLKRIPHVNVYWFAWADYYPGTLIYTGR